MSDYFGSLELVTPPAGLGLAVSRERAKKQCEQDHNYDDTKIDDLIRSAAAFIEQEVYGNRQLLRATFDLPAVDFGCWPCELRLPRPPLASVTSISYRDADDATQTLSSSVYLVRTPWRQPGTIELGPGQSWPATTSLRRYPVTIRFVAGYVAGDATDAAIASAIPAQARQAMLMLVKYWYETPGAVVMGTISKEVEFSVNACVAQLGWGSYA